MALFAPFGTVVSAKVMLDVQTCESRGFGFVFFASADAASRAQAAMDGRVVQIQGASCTIDVRPSDWDVQPVCPSDTIFVRNLPLASTDESLRTFFSRFGTVLSISCRLHSQAVEASGKSAAGSPGSRDSEISAGLVAPAPATKTSDSPEVHAAPPTTGDVPPLECGGADSDEVSGEEAFAGTSCSAGAAPNAPRTPVTITVKLATVQYSCKEEAARAIDGVHRRRLFHGMDVPLLAKYADAPGSRRSTKAKGFGGRTGGDATPVNNLPVEPPFLGAVPATSNPHFVAMNHAPLFVAQPPMTLGGPPLNPASFVTAAQGVRFPDAVPLPLAPRGGFQRIFYQGTLGITPDGLLYPIRPEMCFYEPSAEEQPRGAVHHSSMFVPVADGTGGMMLPQVIGGNGWTASSTNGASGSRPHRVFADPSSCGGGAFVIVHPSRQLSNISIRSSGGITPRSRNDATPDLIGIDLEGS
jgi:RNA recognition motif-containing protein